MSALWAPNWTDDDPEQSGRTPLRSVAPPPARLARFPFMLVLIGVFGVGMGGLLMLNTTLQNQAFQSRALTRQATELAYQQADLENQLDAQSAPQELAQKASALGMRANPYPAFLVLPGGKVIGKAEPVTGHEVPSLWVKTPAEIEADRLAAEAKKQAEAAKKKAEAEQKAAEAKKKAELKAKAEAEAKKKAAADAKKSGKSSKKPAGGH